MQASRHTRTRIGLIIISVVAVGAVLALSIGAIRTLAARNASVHTYSQSDAQIANPDRGWYEPIADLAATPSAASDVPASITLARSFVQLDKYRTSALPADFLKRLGQGLETAQEHNVGIILRFAYNDGPSVGSQDASADTILEHIKQISPILHKHAAALAGVEAGFIGAWGEWHGSSNNLDNDTAARIQIVEALSKAVPAPTPIMLRYPYDIRAVQKAWSANPTYKASLTRIGSHQDCFLASDPDDWGTWGQRGGTVTGDKRLVASLKHAMVGGETCNPSPPTRTNCSTALSEMALLHFTYLNRRYEPNSLERLRSGGCMGTITNKMGYRLTLDTATWPQTAQRNGDKFSVKLAINNTGFAAPTMPRKLTIVLIRGKDRVTRTLINDVRTLKPGKHDLSNQFTLPASTPRGTYTVYLGIPPTLTTATDTPRNSGIELANTRIWNERLQLNRLGTVKVR